MSYLLLAIENLAVALLFVALVVAFAARCRPWLRWSWIAAAVILWLALYAIAIRADYYEEFDGNAQTGLLMPLVMMAAVFVVGAAFVIWRGLRASPMADPGTDRVSPAAGDWPRGRLAVALGLAVVLNQMTLANLDAAAGASIDTLRAEARALALSVAPEPVPDEENAATYYLQVYEALGYEGLNSPEEDDPSQKFWIDACEAVQGGADAEEFDFGSDKVGEFLSAHRGEIDLLRRGAALEHYYCDYGRLELMWLMPDTSAMRQAGRLLAIQARYSAARGDTASALADVTALGGVARHGRSDPYGLTWAVGAWLDRLAFDTLQVVLRSQNPSAEALEKAHIDHLFSYRRQMGRLLRYEEAEMLNVMTDLDTQLTWSTPKWLAGADPKSTYFGHTSGGIAALGLAPIYRVFVLLPAFAAYRRGMELAHASTSMPYADFTARVEHIESSLAGRGVFAEAASLSLRLAKETYRGDAYNLVAYTALAMHRYHAEHGRFPETLDELTPDVIPIVPADPYANQPLKLETTTDGWIVYSVGPDATDNHGAPWDSKQRSGDIGFVYKDEG